MACIDGLAVHGAPYNFHPLGDPPQRAVDT